MPDAFRSGDDTRFLSAPHKGIVANQDPASGSLHLVIILYKTIT